MDQRWIKLKHPCNQSPIFIDNINDNFIKQFVPKQNFLIDDGQSSANEIIFKRA